jgi:TolB-like protein
MGNVYVCGVFYSKLDIGGGVMTANGLDGFLTKLDPAGNHIWTKQYTGASSQYPISLAIDSAGNVIVVGGFAGTTDFGGGPLVATDLDVFVAKYDSAGNHLWSRRYGEVDVQSASKVAIDSADNIAIGGTLIGAADFGGGLMTATDIDLFGVKLDPNGNHLWSKRFDQALGSQPDVTGVAIDSAGNVAFTGYFFATIDVGGGPLASAGDADVFVVKLGSAGQHLWSKRFGTALSQHGTGVGFDGAGNLYLAGDVAGSIDFGGGALVSAGIEDGFVAKLDAAGGHLWSKRYGDSQSQGFYDIAVNNAGDIALSYLLRGTVDFGGGPLTGNGVDIATVRLDSLGNHVWSRRAGDASPQNVNGISFDKSGYVLITGELVGSADLGSGLLTSAGSSDLLIAKLAP